MLWRSHLKHITRIGFLKHAVSGTYYTAIVRIISCVIGTIPTIYMKDQLFNHIATMLRNNTIMKGLVDTKLALNVSSAVYRLANSALLQLQPHQSIPLLEQAELH